MVLATSMSVIISKIKTFPKTSDLEQELQHIPYTQYPIQIGQQLLQAFIDLSSKVNAIHLDFAGKLSF